MSRWASFVELSGARLHRDNNAPPQTDNSSTVDWHELTLNMISYKEN